MPNDDPLHEWSQWSPRPLPTADRAKVQAQLGGELVVLERWLNTPAAKRQGNLDKVIEPGWGAFYGFDRADLVRAQALYRRVVETGGKGNQYVQEQLLKALAANEDPVLIPFWREMVDFHPRPRDQFLARRRTLALAAMAWLSIRQDAPDADLALRGLAHHLDPAVRAEAIYYLGAVFRQAQRSPPADIAGQLVGIATQDPVFAPRFRARAILREHGLPVPFDWPGGIYELRVQLAGVQRTLLLRSENTLEELHFAIQEAFGWDADHLYCFFMNGQQEFDDYRIVSPTEEDGPYWVYQMRMGELGLVSGHRFVYYFDYGDGNQFDIEVTNICLRATPGKYPKVTESTGDPPEQYLAWEPA